MGPWPCHLAPPGALPFHVISLILQPPGRWAALCLSQRLGISGRLGGHHLRGVGKNSQGAQRGCGRSGSAAPGQVELPVSCETLGLPRHCHTHQRACSTWSAMARPARTVGLSIRLSWILIIITPPAFDHRASVRHLLGSSCSSDQETSQPWETYLKSRGW